jgi:tellurite methyltransferase
VTTRKPFGEENHQPGKIDIFGGGKPSEPVVKAAEKLTAGAKVLDIGCGEGRNAIHLAGLGLNVTAFDISVAGVGKLLQIAGQKRLKINALVADMREFEFTGPFDLIISMGCLHLVSRPEWQDVIRRMQEATIPGGYNVIGILTDAKPEPEDIKGFQKGLFKEGELFKEYSGWEIIHKVSYEFRDRHPGGFVHEHVANEIIARKRV